MSVQAISWAFEQRIPPMPKIVLLSIANSADKHGDNAFSSQNYIAEDASMSERSVRRHVQWLELNGYIARTYRSRDNGSRTSDMYTLSMGRKDRGSGRKLKLVE